MTRVCIIARADLTGLGIQSRNWVRLLDPNKVIIINSNPFNNNEQHFEWYNKRQNAYIVDGFIQQGQLEPILRDVDVLLTFEIPYNYQLILLARAMGVKTIIQNNWEFTDYLRQPDLPLPDLLVNHSYWNLDKQQNIWPSISEYCATPLFVEDYESIYTQNISRTPEKKRFLHIAGRKTYEDRNGTNDLLEAMKLVPEEYDFELVIKAQNADVAEFTDSRIVVDRNSPFDERELYRDFDAMIMPRRYGGACLPMNEALASGLPVIMPDIDPNNKILPKEWLVSAHKTGTFMARTIIDVYSVDYQSLADKIIEFVFLEDKSYNTKAREIAVKEYSAESVREKWSLLLAKLGV
jgi:glycosyltransferase involved in cell wall biosynthesis